MNWKKAFQLASIYVGSVVGAGFATGKEIVEFFSRFGSAGIIGILIAGICFIVFGVKIMLLSVRLGANSFHQLNLYVYGPYITPVINIIMFFMLIGVTAVMLSGAGSVFDEQLGIPKEAGVIFTIISALIILLVGTKGLVAVNTVVVPLLIANSLFLAFRSSQMPNFWTNVTESTTLHIEPIFSAIAYVAFNVTLTMAILVPASSDIGDERTVKAGGIMGGIILMVILLMSHITLVQLPDLLSYHIPMAVMMKKLAVSFYFFFVIVIYGEIFTSIIGNIYGLERFLQRLFTIKTLYIGIVILMVAYFISKIDYGILLSTLYPLFGYISITFLVLLTLKAQKKKDL